MLDVLCRIGCFILPVIVANTFCPRILNKPFYSYNPGFNTAIYLVLVFSLHVLSITNFTLYVPFAYVVWDIPMHVVYILLSWKYRISFEPFISLVTVLHLANFVYTHLL